MPIEVTFSKTISNTEIADAFVSAADIDQAEILVEMVENVRTWRNGFSWQLQCQSIVDQLGDHPRRSEIARMLRNLVDHLEETPTSVLPKESEDG